MSTETKLKRLAVAWLLEADWPRWCSMDPDFQPSFDHWLQRMTATYERLEAQGAPVVKVTLDPDEFLAWSTAAGAGVGTDARAAYAAAVARRMDAN